MIKNIFTHIVIVCMTIITIILCIRVRNLNNTIIEKNNEFDDITNDYNESCCNDIIYECNLIEPIKNYNKAEYLTRYKMIIDKYKGFREPPETVYDCFSEEQINIMWKCIETETFECDFDSKVNVANVILNRVENELYPTDPIEIIKGDNQFAYGRDKISNDTKLALEYAFLFGVEETNDCIGFRSDKCPNTWNGWEYCYNDGSHYFYKIKE